MQNEKYTELTSKYGTFVYHGFSLEETDDSVKIAFDFEIEGLTSFRPATVIKTDNLILFNRFDSEVGKNLVFSLGMVELISYWKCACCPNVRVECGTLSDEQIAWWKRLYFSGLSEFFYRNSIEADGQSFMNITSSGPAYKKENDIVFSDRNIIPVGGGKDSAVTIELLRNSYINNLFFTVNDQQARSDTVRGTSRFRSSAAALR